MPPESTRLTDSEVMTLEAFADTIIPGERRHATDRAVAGAADGGVSSATSVEA